MRHIIPATLARASVVVAMALLGASGANAEMQKLKVASTIKEIVDNLPFYVGMDKGIFKKHDIELELTHFNGGGEVVRAIAGGAAEIGMVGTSAAIIAAARGEPMKLVSSWTAPAYGIVFIVPKDSPIKSAKDLDGKRVGITRPGKCFAYRNHGHDAVPRNQAKSRSRRSRRRWLGDDQGRPPRCKLAHRP